MKRLFAILLFCLMLAAPAVAEELYTFAGVPWDTPISECEAALEEGTGAGFRLLDELADDRYLVIEPGYYSVLGMPFDTTGNRDSIMVYYDVTEAARMGEALPEDDAAWALKSIICTRGWTPLDARGSERLYGFFDNITRKYGEPTLVCLQGPDDAYIVPQAEYPYIVRDAFAYSQEQNWGGFYMVMAFRNVGVILNADVPGQSDDGVGSYELMLAYMPTQVFEYLEEEAMESFPWVNGEPEYLVIEP